MKSNSAIRIAMLQRLLQSGAALSVARAAYALWAVLRSTTLPRTPKMGFAMGTQWGDAFGAGNAVGNAIGFDPGGLASTS